MSRRLWLALPLVAFAAACGEDGLVQPSSTAGDNIGGPAVYVAPSVVAGNPTCEDLGYDFGFKIDHGGTDVNGTWQIGSLGSVTVTGDGTTWSWTSTFGIDAAFSKGGPQGNLYVYNPESFGDNGLVSPNNSSGGPAAISHIEFCFDIELRVSKTAATTYTRTWDWSIDKTGSTDALLLSSGQTSPIVNYGVAVSSTSTDSDWAASGTITIYNPAPFATNIASVTDVMTGDIAGTVDCGTLPAAIAAGGTMTCTYSASLPDASARLNTATATADGTVGSGVGFYGSGAVGAGSGTAEVTFGDPTSLIDESVSVSDSRQGALGTATGSGNWSYGMTFGPYTTCGEYSEGNTATFTTNDRGLTGSDSWNVAVTVTNCDEGGGDPPPGEGCTLTQGYWKTHSARGNAPYDNNWANLAGGLEHNTIFFNSGASWYTVFWTAPKGNAYYQLAHQWMAAHLNVLNGASTTAAVDAALAQGAAILAGANGVRLTKANATLATSLAGVLGSYNEGLTGPGHCSE